MRKITFWVLGFILGAIRLSFSQELPSGFSDNAPCSIRPNNATDPFDWRRPMYDLYLNKFGGLKIIESPWYAATTNNLNINRFRLEQVKDWDPSQGWELVQRDFGAPGRNINHPYLILYNRYRGIIRVFVAIGDIEDGYNKAVITLSYANAGANSGLTKRTAILGNYSSRTGKSALDNFDNQVAEIAVANAYSYDLPFWMYADFVMMYDPCTCNSLSQLLFDVRLISTSTLNFTLNGQAVQNLGLDQSGQGNGGKQSLVKTIGGAIAAGTGMYETVEKGVKKLDEIFKLKEKTQDLKYLDSRTGTFLPVYNHEKYKNILKGLGKLPAIGAAAGVVDFMVGVFTATDAEPQPMMFDIKLKGEGTINFEGSKLARIIENPGSNNTQIIPQTLIQYNNTMGIFNLIKSPTIKKSIDAITSYKSLRVIDDLQYAVNPSTMFTNYDIYGSIVINTGKIANSIQVEGIRDLHGILIQENDSIYRTRNVPIQCLKDIVILSDNSMLFSSNVKLYVKVMMFAKTPDPNSQELMFVFQYEPRLQTETVYNDPTFANIPRGVLLPVDYSIENGAATVYRSSNNILAVQAINTITIGANVTYTTNQPIALIAGKSVGFKAGASITPNLNPRIRYHLPADCGHTLGQATTAQIKAVCNSAAYTNLANGNTADGRHIVPTRAKVNAGITMDAYPNPFTGNTTITYSLPKADKVYVSISDLLGKRIQTLVNDSYTSTGTHQVDFDGKSLPAGIYFYSLQVGDFKETKRLIIVH